MATYISVLNQKGGAGKTATTGNLSGAFHKMGFKVLAVDADNQESLLDWWKQAEPPSFPFEVLGMHHAHLHTKLPNIAEPAGFDYVLIDCPPGGSKNDDRDRVSRSAGLLADIVLVPLPPKPTDFLAIKRLKTLLLDLCAVKPDLLIAVVINEKEPGGRMSRTARESAFELLDDEALNLTVLETEIYRRSVIAESVAYGYTVHDQKHKTSSQKDALHKASAEYLALAKEIKTCRT